MRGLLAALLAVAAAACSARHPGAGVPAGDGPLVGVYKATIDEGDGVIRRAKLNVWAARPDRIHVEFFAPISGVAFILDSGGGAACVLDVSHATAYAGKDGPGAIEALAGVRVSIADAVSALLTGASPAGVTVTRTGGESGALPESIRFDEGPRSLTLVRMRYERGRGNVRALGTGLPPARFAVRPIAELKRATAPGVPPGDGGR